MGTTCHGSVLSLASCSQTGIYTLFPLLISTVFIVVSHVGCRGVTGVMKMGGKKIMSVQVIIAVGV